MPSRRPLPALLLVAAAASVGTGCGGEQAPAAPAKAVRLELTQPLDDAVTDADSVSLRGRVSPAASEVRIRGESIASDGGTFAAEVELEPGTNVVDVAASADGRRPAITAIRVLRRMPVEIPSLDSQAVDAATDRLRALGLRVEVRAEDGLLEPFLSGEPRVCRSDPEAGERVRAQTTVTLEVGKRC